MHFLHPSNFVRRNGPARVLTVYLLYSAAWIALSDFVVHTFFPHTPIWHTAKGMAFLITSGAILYALLRRMVAETNRLEHTLRQIFCQSAFGIYFGDKEGNILDCNEAFADLVAQKPAELVGSPISNLIDLETRDTFRTEWSRSFHEQDPVRDVHRLRFVGDTPVLMASSQIDDPEVGSFRVALTHDISAEIEAFEKLKQREAYLEQTLASVRQSELRFKRLVEANLNGIAVCSLDGLIKDANSEFLRMTGISRVELDQGDLRWADITPSEYHDRDVRALSGLANSKRFPVYEKELITRHGERFPVLISGALLSEPADESAEAALSIIDLRDAKTKEAQLSRLVLAVENAHESIVITDVDANIVYVNPAFEKLTGYDRTEAIGKNPNILRSGRTPKHHIEKMWTTLARGEVWHGRFWNRRKDGTEYEEDATVTPVRNSQGEVINYLAVKKDITREQELEQQLLQSQKMEAIGQLAGGVAHDLNNVLQVVQSSAELGIWKGDVEYSRKKLNDILHASERGAAIVAQLLAFSRQQKSYPRALDLNEVVADTSRMLRRLLPEDVDFQVDLGKNVARVNVDVSQITQILLNMAANARDAMPNGGTFTMKTRNEFVQSDDISVPDRRMVVLTISDSGHGMEAHLIQKIFEPFFTTKLPGKGTGLGLSTVYGIVKQSGGSIAVESYPDKGTSFEISFPAADSADGPKEGARIDWTGAPKVGTVLVCDDDMEIRSALCEYLESIGAKPVCCATPDEAVQLALTSSPAMLITDVVMPGMSGIDLAKRIKEIRSEVKVLFITGHTQDTLLEKYPISQSMSFLQKPFSAKSLVRQLNELFRPEASS